MTSDHSALVQRLQRLNCGVVSDVLDECGYPHQALASGIRPLDPRMRLAGRAVCFSGESIARGAGESGKSLSTYDMDKGISLGSVAVIATNGHSVSAVVGGLMSLAFSKLGCAGIVCDGGVRDASEIVELGLPAFAQFVTPMRSNRRWQLTATDRSVTLPGQEVERVAVDPGDYLIGDADGVMVIPGAIASDVIGWAEHLAAIEERIVKGLNAGEAREKVFTANPRFAHIRRLRE